MSKIIKIRCETRENIKINELENFQNDNFKEFSEESSEKLKKAIIKYGIFSPIFVWKKKIIDGHHRVKVLKELKKEGYEFGDIPVFRILAGNEKDAAEKLLIFNSRYAEITKGGLDYFLADFEIGKEDLKDIQLSDFPDFDLEEEIKKDDKITFTDKIEINKEILQKINKEKNIYFSFSGGQDSSLAFFSVFPFIEDKKKIELLFVETGVEIPDIKNYVLSFASFFGVKLNILKPKKDFLQHFEEKKAFPCPIFRDCISLFINDPLDDFVFKEGNEKGLLIRGGRAKQKIKGGKSKEFYSVFPRKSRKKELFLFNPLFSLSDKAFSSLKLSFEKEVKVGLWKGYSLGFKRTSCWICPFQQKEHYVILKKYYPLLFSILNASKVSFCLK